MIKLNGKPINVTMFPDNTSQVWKNYELYVYNEIVWEYSHEGELFHLIQLKDLIDSRYSEPTDCRLYIPYLPYARQDKKIDPDKTFALHSFAKILNNLNFKKVISFDPHSEEAGNLIHNFEIIKPIKEIYLPLGQTSSDIVCYPDIGALRKYRNFINFKYIYGEKERDQKTGYIKKYELQGSPDGKKVLIVDDICDGGMTFILLTKQLLEAGATEVNLYVSHGIFSKGLKPLKEAGINRIFTKDGEVSEVQGQIAYKELV